MSYKKLIARETLILFISSVLTAISGYFLKVFLAKSLTVYDYGLFFGVFNFVGSFIPIKDIGLASTVVRYLPEYNVKNDKKSVHNAIKFLFFFQLIIYMLILAAGFLFARPAVARLFNDPRSYYIFLVLLVSYFFSVFDSTFNATYLGFKKISYFSVFQFVASIIIMLSCFATKFFSVTPEAVAKAYFVAFFLTTSLEFPFFLSIVPGLFKERFTYDKNQIKEFFSFSIFQFFTATIKNLSHTLSTLIMAAISTIENVAYLNISMPTANLIKFLFKPISIVLLPISSEIHAQNDKSLGTLISSIYKYLILFFIPIGIFFIYFSDKIIHYLFSDKYAMASASLSLFVFAYFFISIFELNSSILLGYKKKKEALFVSIIFLISNFALSIVLIRLQGLNGAAIAYLISTVIATIVTISYLSQMGLIKSNIFQSIWLMLLGLVVFMISLAFSRLFDILVAYLLSMILYSVAIFLFRFVTINELKEMFQRLF